MKKEDALEKQLKENAELAAKTIKEYFEGKNTDIEKVKISKETIRQYENYVKLKDRELRLKKKVEKEINKT